MAYGADGDDPPKRALRLASPRSYDVGYGKPPTSSRFQPGRSGNPKGRPKGARTRRPQPHAEALKSIILQEAYRTIKVRDGDRNITVPMAQAIVRSMAVTAAKGNVRAAALLTQMVKVVEDDDKRRYDEYLQAMIEYKCDWEREIEHCRRLGLEPPNPIPHPDHILVDFNTGSVRIVGPFCKEDIPRWNKLRRRKAECDRAIAAYRRDLLTETDPLIRRGLEDEIAHEQKIRAMISCTIPD